MTTKDLIVGWYQNKFNESSGKLNQAGHNAIREAFKKKNCIKMELFHLSLDPPSP